jgi:hypothetical protein
MAAPRPDNFFLNTDIYKYISLLSKKHDFLKKKLKKLKKSPFLPQAPLCDGKSARNQTPDAKQRNCKRGLTLVIFAPAG